MLSTTVFFSLIIGLTLATLLLEAALLRWGAKILKIENATWRRVVWAMLLVTLTHYAIVAAVGLMLPEEWTAHPAIIFIALGLLLLTPVAIIAGVLHARVWKAALAWLPTLFATIIVNFTAAVVVRDYVIEAFVLPSNSMAPTLMGPHWEGVCAKCGSLAVCSPMQLFEGEHPEPQLMICTEHFHETIVDEFNLNVRPQDRIIVSKYLSPRRWDMMVFQYPADPSTNYVMRVVGLPGEEVTIRDGAVWIDGEQYALPQNLQGLKYVAELEFAFEDVAGSPEFPAQLADDEYFVLGDFSSRSKDSRLWSLGAPGHAPYAVPADYIIGVVTHTYWPPSRWRVFR